MAETFSRQLIVYIERTAVMGAVTVDVLDAPTWWATAFTAVSVLLVAFLTRHLRGPKTFDLPILGIESGDTNALKTRYVQEADVLLREGYQKVRHHELWPIIHT